MANRSLHREDCAVLLPGQSQWYERRPSHHRLSGLVWLSGDVEHRHGKQFFVRVTIEGREIGVGGENLARFPIHKSDGLRSYLKQPSVRFLASCSACSACLRSVTSTTAQTLPLSIIRSAEQRTVLISPLFL